MSNQTNKDGWEDDVPEFDAEKAQIETDKEDRAIHAEIKRREGQ